MYTEKIFGVLAKIETVSGTDSVPTAALDAVRCVGIPELKLDFLEPGNRDDVQLGQLGTVDRAAPAGRFGTIEITLEARAPGTAYSAATVPESDVFWRGAGFSRTLVVTPGSELVRYTTLDLGFETFTLYAYSAGKLFRLVGCVCMPKCAFEVNKRGLLTFSVTGRLVTDPTETAVPALTFKPGTVPLFHSAANAIGTWLSSAGSDPLVLRKVDVDCGTVVNDRPSAGATDGLIGYQITDRKVRQTMLVEVPALATFDIFAAAKLTGAANPLSNYQLGTAQYGRVKVETGRWALEAPQLSGDRGIKMATLAGNLVLGAAPTTNREINVTYD